MGQDLRIITSPLLRGLLGIRHGYSTRKLGDVRQAIARRKVLQALGLSPESLVWPQQIHESNIVEVHQAHRGQTIMGADGLVYRRDNAVEVTLGVHVADCVPLLFGEVETGVIGVAHAGWRGTLAGISAKMVAQMQKLGAKPENIRVALGPHIGKCCYDVSQERAAQFLNVFRNDGQVVTAAGGKWYVDLGLANKQQLIAAGILPGHIDISPFCTACYEDKFFSYRQSRRETFGEMMGVIALA